MSKWRCHTGNVWILFDQKKFVLSNGRERILRKWWLHGWTNGNQFKKISLEDIFICCVFSVIGCSKYLSIGGPSTAKFNQDFYFFLDLFIMCRNAVCRFFGQRIFRSNLASFYTWYSHVCAGCIL